MRRVIVVGASSGIGASLVRALCARGDAVVGIARRTAELDALATTITAGRGGTVHMLTHDVTHTEEVPSVFAAAVERLGGVDVVIYNAGVMPDVRIDEFDSAKDRFIIEVNVIGAMAWLNEAARALAAQGRGVIVGVGSVAGERGRAGQPAYNASKAALHTYLEALRNRLDRRGVRVVTIKPGPVRTAMLGDKKMPLTVEADAVAAVIVRAIEGGPLVRYVHAAWAPIMAVIRSVPSLLFRRFGPP